MQQEREHQRETARSDHMMTIEGNLRASGISADMLEAAKRTDRNRRARDGTNRAQNRDAEKCIWTAEMKSVRKQTHTEKKRYERNGEEPTRT